MPWKAYIFLQSKPFFESHYCGETNSLLPGYPPEGLLHVLQLKYHLVVLPVVVSSGHSWSSHIT